MSAIQESKIFGSQKRKKFRNSVFRNEGISQAGISTPASDYCLSKTKRAFDILSSGLALIALSPLFLMIAIAIRVESKGPAFFRQERWGVNQTKIQIYKFRSMFIDMCDASGIAQTTEDDPRLTRVGAVLRRFNLDELPQLINVLQGTMSIVGPRCHVPNMLAGGVLYEDLVPEYHDRHFVKPGLTGLAQMKGFRGPTVDAVKARRRIALDLKYVETASFWLDIKICILTALNEVHLRKGF